MDANQLAKLVSDGFDKAKQGDAIATYLSFLPHLKDGSLPEKSHYPFGWIIYYALHQSPDNDVEPRKHMLANYLKLKVTVPHKLHSMILTQAIRLYKDARNASFGKRREEVTTFSILKFLNLWNFDNLRQGDWNRKEHDGQRMPSTVEKLMTVCCDELEDMRTNPPREIWAILESLHGMYPDSDSINAQLGALHELSGNSNEAARFYRSSILLSPVKFHLWKKLAMLIDPEQNPHLRVALLYKALLAPGQEQFKGKVRIELARTLAQRGAFPQAMWEMQRVKNLYEANGWHLSPSFLSISKLIPEGTTPSDPTSLYKKVEHLADNELYSALTPLVATKTYHKPSAPDPKSRSGMSPVAWRLTDAEGNNYWIQPHRFKMAPDHPVGTRVSIRLHNGRAVSAELLPDASGE